MDTPENLPRVRITAVHFSVYCSYRPAVFQQRMSILQSNWTRLQVSSNYYLFVNLQILPTENIIALEQLYASIQLQPISLSMARLLITFQYYNKPALIFANDADHNAASFTQSQSYFIFEFSVHVLTRITAQKYAYRKLIPTEKFEFPPLLLKDVTIIKHIKNYKMKIIVYRQVRVMYIWITQIRAKIQPHVFLRVGVGSSEKREGAEVNLFGCFKLAPN